MQVANHHLYYDDTLITNFQKTVTNWLTVPAEQIKYFKHPIVTWNANTTLISFIESSI